jgi:hypothetical protein
MEALEATMMKNNLYLDNSSSHSSKGHTLSAFAISFNASNSSNE